MGTVIRKVKSKKGLTVLKMFLYQSYKYSFFSIKRKIPFVSEWSVWITKKWFWKKTKHRILK